jgi:putative endonuclease
VAVTSDLVRRIAEHRSGPGSEFVRGYGVRTLVFAGFHETMTEAIMREKRMKKWRRSWKLQMIERHHPQWRDLRNEVI